MSRAISRALRMARARKADGGAAFGTGSPAEESERPSGVANLLGSAYNTLGSLSKRAIEGAAQYRPGSGEISKETIAPTVETALSLAGAGMPFAQKGAAGIFGGRLAQTADHAALAKAEKMATEGADRHSIWNETGWFRGPDQKWRFEINDSSSIAQPGITSSAVAAKLDHPDLYAAYPGIENTRLGWGSPPQSGSYARPSYAGDLGDINISQMDSLGQQKASCCMNCSTLFKTERVLRQGQILAQVGVTPILGTRAKLRPATWNAGNSKFHQNDEQGRLGRRKMSR